MYNKLVAKVDAIDTSGFALKTNYNTDKSRRIQKISDTSGLDAKITKTEGKIPSISGLATSAALTVVENEILDVSNLAQKKQIVTQKY